jgi:hypothetical protein
MELKEIVSHKGVERRIRMTPWGGGGARNLLSVFVSKL